MGKISLVRFDLQEKGDSNAELQRAVTTIKAYVKNKDWHLILNRIQTDELLYWIFFMRLCILLQIQFEVVFDLQ